MANSNLYSKCSLCNVEINLLSLLGQEEAKYIDETRTEAIFSPGETILKQGAPVNNILFFVSGLAKAYIETGKKQNLIVHLYKSQDFVAVPGIYFENINHYTITAIEDSRVIFYDWIRFKEILKSNQLLNTTFLEFLNSNHVKTLERLINLHKKQSKGRIAESLICLSETIYKTGKFRLTLSITDIAQLAGISLEGTFKVIKEFTEASLISINNKNFEILNPDRLKEISEKG